MPLHELTSSSQKTGATRLQIMGAPASLKTTICATFDKPEVIIGLPGEKHTDILTPTSDLRIVIFDPPDYSNKNYDWVKLWNEVRLETQKAIDGSYGQPQTLVFDGAHKAFYAVYLAAKQKFAASGGDWDGRRGWPWVNDEFLAWFSQAYYSKVPWVIWTVWAAKEQDDQLAAANSEAAKKQSIWPDYMGKFQRTCMGETNIIYQYVEGGKPYWQIRQDDKVKGVGLRVSPDKAVSLPIRIPANWAQLKAILQPSQGVTHVTNTAKVDQQAHEAILGQPAGITG